MNEILHWFAERGKDTLETIALIAGLCFTAASFRADSKERKIANLMTAAASHRDLWLQITEKPELARVLEKDLDLKKHPVSEIEKRFVHLLITNLAVNYTAMKAGVLPDMQGLEKDVRVFLSLPIPHHVWLWSREFQEPAFVEFVQKCLSGE
jgi:hypothetical protein